jgi:hypothetical protein
MYNVRDTSAVVQYTAPPFRGMASTKTLIGSCSVCANEAIEPAAISTDTAMIDLIVFILTSNAA